VTPGTAAFAGPALLGRAVDLRNPRDNADLGAALLRRYVDEFNDPKLALAAYYQGEAGTRKDGIYPGSHGYVDGIWALRNRFEQGQLP
jgi:soluble lytic murein transglycosylase-like protein